MPRRPWYPKNPSDYLADTAMLSLEAHGMYNLLLDYLWLHDGELPANYEQLSRLLRADVRKVRRIFVSELKPYFDVKNGAIKQQRVTAEITKAIELSEKNTNSAYARWHASADANADPPAAGMQCKTDANQQPQPQVKEKSTKKKADYHDIEGLNAEAYERWIENRRERKLPAYKTLATAKKLASCSPEVQAWAVQQSIDHEWRGVFPENYRDETHQRLYETNGERLTREAEAMFGSEFDGIVAGAGVDLRPAVDEGVRHSDPAEGLADCLDADCANGAKPDSAGPEKPGA